LHIPAAALAAATVIYFAAARLVQDYLYRGNQRPENLFASLGEFFAIAEPYEIPLYFFGFIAIPVLALCIAPLGRRLNFPKIWKFLGVAVLLGFLAFGLRFFEFDRYVSYVGREGIGKALWLLLTKRLFVTRLILGSSLVVFIFFYLRNFRFEWLFRLDQKIPWRKMERLFMLALAVLVFHPNFPVDPHHYNYFMGPVNDIVHGKGLLYETTSLYGLFNIYFLLAAFTILPFSFVSLSFITAIFYFVFFAAIYFFLKAWLKSPALAAFGAASVYAIMFLFNTSPTRSVYLFPAMGPFRFWLYVPVLWLLYFYQNRPRPILRELAIFLSAASLFWNFESGIALCAGTFAVFALESRLPPGKFVKLGLEFLGYIAAIIALITVVNYAVYGSMPGWIKFFKELLPFGSGIGMTPLPGIGVFDIFVFLYLAAALIFLQNYRRGQTFDLPAVFLTVYGVFYSLYYVGQSTWQNLYLVAVPPILLGAYLLKNYREERSVRAAFYSFLILIAMFFAVKLPVEFKNRDYGRLASLSAVPAADADLWQDAEYIKEHFAGNRIPLVHLRDTTLLVHAQKSNLLDLYYFFTLYYTEDVERAARDLEAQKPPILLVGKKRNDQIDYFMSFLKNYRKSGELNTLEIYERAD